MHQWNRKTFINVHLCCYEFIRNAVDEKSIVHWHGLDVSHENDGHPHFAVESGKSYEYDFEVVNRAGMYWYHPHPHGRTAFQVYAGDIIPGLWISNADPTNFW